MTTPVHCSQKYHNIYIGQVQNRSLLFTQYHFHFYNSPSTIVYLIYIYSTKLFQTATNLTILLQLFDYTVLTTLLRWG